MAYTFGTNRYLSTASSPISGPPLTIAAWLRPTGLVSTRAVAVGVNGGTHRNQMTLTTTSGVLVLSATSVGTGGTATSQNNTSVSVNTLFHACVVFASSASRTAYLNGEASTTNQTNITQNAADAISIGSAWNTTLGAYFGGDIAEVGIWNVGLAADDVASLADGFTPALVRPESLVFYAPLVRDLVDVRGGLTITNNNTATVAVHPRVYA